jgi:hypothetical protein
MPREPQHIREFKKFIQGDPTADDLPRLEAEIYGTNDRARAVMLGAFVELSLEIFLKNKRRPSLNSEDTRDMFDYSGPLGTFSSKILIGYAFNWYGPETRKDLTLIRTLRNGFAHSRKSFDFESESVANICGLLQSPDWPGSFIPKGYLELVRDETAHDKKHPRTRYISACHTLSERLFQNAGVIRLIGATLPDLR